MSGIADPALLQQHQIPVVHALPGVGENLQDHLQMRMVFKVDGARTLNAMASTLVGKMKIGLEYLLMQSGPMSMAPSQLGAFAKSDAQQASANLQYHVQPLSLENSAIRCMPSRPSRPACATCVRPRAATCAWARPITPWRPGSPPTISPPKKTSRSPPTRCA
jgi:choline dehydrogenase-like flavoprotein